MVLPEMLEVPEEFKRILAMPVLVELDGETGAIRAVKVSKSEPEWSVNYKKGIVSLFQVKMESSLSSNMVSISLHIHVLPSNQTWQFQKTSVIDTTYTPIMIKCDKDIKSNLLRISKA